MKRNTHRQITTSTAASCARSSVVGGKTMLMFCALLFSSFQPDRDRMNEYKLKAAFIYNFTLYIDWDAATAAASEVPANQYIIGVLGSSLINDPLQEIAKAKSGSDKKIVVKRFNDLAEITFCHILFIPQTCPYELDAILAKAPKGSLVVGEKPGLAKKGCAMNFIIVNNKLKFESNLKAISSAGLKASSQLLKLAIIVEDK